MSAFATGFRETFALPGRRETVRAFVISSILLLAILGLGGELAFRELSLTVLRDRLDLGRHEAETIARGLEALRPKWMMFDDTWLPQNKELIERLIHARIRGAHYIHHVEVRDSAGHSLVYVEGLYGRRGRSSAAKLPVPFPPPEEEIIHVPLLDERSEAMLGEVRLAVSPGALQKELEELRRSLWVKISGAGALALLLLVIGFFYLLYLLRRNRELEQARQSAARASYVGLLASGLAHEIRNPLNAMNMNLQMLEEELTARPEPTDPEHAELLDSTKSEIKRLERLVNNFLAYARPSQPRLESSDLNRIVREVVRLLEADTRQSGVDLREDLEPLLPHVETDEAQFKQALINLLVNARQVMKDGGTVVVRTRAGSHGEVVLEVEDDGPGIPPETRLRIFEVFYSSRGGGTGLGLPIARQIVERHGGTIEVESTEGHGTTFRIRLPRHHRRAADPTARSDRTP